MPSPVRIALLLLLAWPGPGEAVAQSAARRLHAPAPAELAPPVRLRRDGGTAHTPEDAASPDPARTALYSLALPGAGQLAQGQRRWMGYAAIEALAWVLHLERKGSGRDLRDRYRELAWETARGLSGPRVVGDFEYYERLSKWTTSGRWDVDSSAPGVQPETDATTYNGAIWDRAASIFFGADPGVGPEDPRWTAALAYYEERAYPPDLLWSWQGEDEAQERFSGLLHESDDRLKEATLMIGVVLANHVVSAADALVSARLREATDGRLEGGLSWLPPGLPGRLGPGPLALFLTVRP